MRLSAPRTPLLRYRSANCYGCSNSAPAAPQNQLQLAECTCRKSCLVGCSATLYALAKHDAMQSHNRKAFYISKCQFAFRWRRLQRSQQIRKGAVYHDAKKRHKASRAAAFATAWPKACSISNPASEACVKSGMERAIRTLAMKGAAAYPKGDR